MIQPFEDHIPLWERGVRLGGNMDKEAMSRNLLDFKEVLDKHKVPFIIIFGGLLGLIREGNFISHDTDLDVACFNEFVRKDHWKLKKIKEDLINKGFYVVGNDECYLHIDFFIRDGEKIEIWWFDKIDDEWIFGNEVRYPAFYFDKFQEIDFLGAQFKIPCEAEKFLRITYGDSWKVPNPKAKNLNLNPKAVEKRT